MSLIPSSSKIKKMKMLTWCKSMSRYRHLLKTIKSNHHPKPESSSKDPTFSNSCVYLRLAQLPRCLISAIHSFTVVTASWAIVWLSSSRCSKKLWKIKHKCVSHSVRWWKRSLAATSLIKYWLRKPMESKSLLLKSSRNLNIQICYGCLTWLSLSSSKAIPLRWLW